MPEGDTIFRAAHNLRPALEGRLIVSARGWKRFLDASQLVQRRVERVQARGKHLLVHLDLDTAIHSHMGMTGSWHIYADGQAWTKPARQAALTIQTDKRYSVVCFTPKLLELTTEAKLRRHWWLSRLGPDLLAPSFDVSSIDEILRRLRIHDATEVGHAIMNQSVVCGIGNAYKSELLFLEKMNPFLPTGSIKDEHLRAVIVRARRLMSRNLEGRPRRTRFGLSGTGGPRLWVYGRSNESCIKCRTSIRMRRQGDLGRSTYFCPQCQGCQVDETFR